MNIHSKKLKRLAKVLIDSLCELTTENNILSDNLDILGGEKIAFTAQLSVLKKNWLQ